MPALFNLGAHLALGSALALSARNSPSFRQAPVSWPLILLFAFHALVAAPVATFLFRFFPQWSMHYAFDPQVFPALADWIGLLSGAVVIANLSCGVLGLVLTRLAILRGVKILELTPLLIASSSWGVLFFLYGERALWVGTYDAYWHEEARLLFVSVPGWVGLGSYLVAIIFVFWVGRRFRAREPSYV